MLKVAIAGAGIGGLTLALMLHKRGIQCQLFEQAGSVREVGVGINVLPPCYWRIGTIGPIEGLRQSRNANA